MNGLEIGVRPNGADCDAMINCALVVQNPRSGPGTGWWLILSTGDSGTRKQIAYDLNGDTAPVSRRYAAKVPSGWEPIKTEHNIDLSYSPPASMWERKKYARTFSNWQNHSAFPCNHGICTVIPTPDTSYSYVLYIGKNRLFTGIMHHEEKNIEWSEK